MNIINEYKKNKHLSCQQLIMNRHINCQMVAEPVDFFGCAPSSTNQAIDVCTKHCQRMIDEKQRISCPLFKLTLTRNCCVIALADNVLVLRVKST